METLKTCVRCNRCSLNEKSLTCGEIANIYVIHKLGLLEVGMEHHVCDECRELIGEESSNNILKERIKDETEDGT
jgi:hypothetical protein